MGYTIQVGAFSNMNNAVRLTEKLHQQGLEAYHFLHRSGLYKVRFGNYMSQQDASWRAESLKLNGIITAYYIVGPDEYAALNDRRYGPSGIRDHLVKTAKRYIGVPYKWGGESAVTGFDCSGYTMVIYQQNGLNLPRSSRQQWKTGKPITPRQLLKGDLVFFATSGGKRVSHVGIYLGGDKFLHSPGRGRKIKTASLSDRYFQSRYLGARTYL
jgi:cell wall-associated NlpC family hydrolase